MHFIIGDALGAAALMSLARQPPSLPFAHLQAEAGGQPADRIKKMLDIYRFSVNNLLIV